MTITLAKNQVVVAMSGGVDSSVAALLLKEQGMEVIGISMKTHEGSEEGGSHTCCTASDINDARRICRQLDIPFYAMNFVDEFEKKVIANFASEYSQGRTPNPCVQCNSQMKFSSLLRKTKELGAYYLATGHYAQKSRDRNGRYHLLRAKDRDKDQTYFLFGLGQDQLEHILFPVGKYGKEEVRGFARAAGLTTAEKPESQEICFVSNNDYARFLEDRFPDSLPEPGPIVSEEGKVLGRHRGIHAYTVGQRRGLGVSAGERIYVTEIVPGENKVVLGGKESLLRSGLIARGVRWTHRDLVTSNLEVEVKIRHRHKSIPATLRILNDSSVRVEFREQTGAVTPGQAAVFYLGEEVLGGGWIERSL